FASPAGVQAHGSAACPGVTVPVGGGAFHTSTSTNANINSSYPGPSGWAVDVNNASPNAAAFTVYAVCVKQPRKYLQVQSSAVDVPGASQVRNITALCPGAFLPLGGGAFSDSLLPEANVNGTLPSPTMNGWRVDANNGSALPTHIVAWAVCGKLKGYHVVIGASVANPAGQQTLVHISCGVGVPISGGALSDSPSTAVNLNTSYPSGDGWTVFENNASGSITAFTPVVV